MRKEPHKTQKTQKSNHIGVTKNSLIKIRGLIFIKAGFFKMFLHKKPANKKNATYFY